MKCNAIRWPRIGSAPTFPWNALNGCQMDWPFIFSPLQSWSAKPFVGKLQALQWAGFLEQPGKPGGFNEFTWSSTWHCGLCLTNWWKVLTTWNLLVIYMGPLGPWSIWMQWWSWIPEPAPFWKHGHLHWCNKNHLWHTNKKYIKVKWPFGGAITEMNHQYGFPSGLEDQRVGINGQHLGRSHGIGMVEGCWHRTLGPNDAIMEKQWHVTLMLLHIYYEVR